MTAPAPLLSIVVLSYDRPAYLRQALASLVAQRVASREVLVVDNPSPRSPAIASVVAEFPEARLLPLERNLGFTGGMNAGIAQARGRYVLLTEDDIVLEPASVAAWLHYAEGERRTAVLTGILLDHGTRRIRSAGGELALGPPFRLRMIGAGESLSGARRDPYEVSFAPGGYLLFAREALEALGGFRPAFFMYLEDVELCLRARRLGIPIVVVPAARAEHLPPLPGPASTALKFHMMKNLLATYALHAPLRALPSVALRYGPLEGIRRCLTGPQEALAFARAWSWLILHLAGLLRARGRDRPT
jgi:GT2 family glycosyltransferase